MSEAEKGLPFKKVINCVLPSYGNCEQKEYITLVQTLVRDILCNKSKDYLIVLSQTNEFNNLPNQLIVGVLLGTLLESNTIKLIAEKVRLVSQDKNICNLFKLELSKVYAQHRTLLEF
jgi:hypothetical protein